MKLILTGVLALALSGAAFGQTTSTDPSAQARPPVPSTGEDKGKAPASPADNPAGGTQPDMKAADPGSPQAASKKAEIPHNKKHKKARKTHTTPEEGK